VPEGLGPGFESCVLQLGAGQVTITGTGDVTVGNRSSFTKTAGQYALMAMIAYAADAFITAGDGAA
jgi:hypothetical protein